MPEAVLDHRPGSRGSDREDGEGDPTTTTGRIATRLVLQRAPYARLPMYRMPGANWAWSSAKGCARLDRMSYPQLGTMLYGGLVNGLPVWSQPGGPGTLVYPQQELGQQVAMFVFQCGHWSNHLNVVVEQSAPGIRSALLICPLCSYVFRIMTPASLYNDDVANYILLP